jgi:predicted nucleic acid-binding protein
VADYLLDTNILSYWYDSTLDASGQVKPTHANVFRNVARVRLPDPQTGYVSRLFVSVVTLGEMEYGHRVAEKPNETKQAAYAKFVRTQCPVVLDVTSHVAEHYGEMRAWLFNNCGPNAKRTKSKRAEQLVFPSTGEKLGIDENDLWIAAQAMTNDLVLVTNDRNQNLGKVLKQFVPRLKVENWANNEPIARLE